MVYLDQYLSKTLLCCLFLHTLITSKNNKLIDLNFNHSIQKAAKQAILQDA